ncbi:carbohydrate ABC transporter permease [Diplocloster modestus]|uniref:Carbohydrate ABC transporter permease n=1 Tax=Diplocloster modestus TaxID=2850322 RepID=A0ABS6KBH3_9FIRM|nr:carbohydrate ABC transporter permease [Diplocloster modestus]MBU9727858.1 carbohydrate ABC transporter permease [Diplocloster modestus]
MKNPNEIQSKCARRLVTAVLGCVVVTTLYPIYWLIVNSFRHTEQIVTGDTFGLPTELYLGNYYDAVVNRHVFRYFTNSVIYTLLTIALTVVISTMLAYALTRMQWKYKKQGMSIAMLGILLPSQIVVIPIFILMRKLHLVDNPLSIIIVISAFNIGISTMIASGFLKGIPYEMEEAAIMDGCGIFRLFFGIIFPLLKSPIAAMSIYIFLNSWNEFIYSLVLLNSDGKKTLPLMLLGYSTRSGSNFGGLFAAMVITSFIPIMIYLFFSKQVEKAISASSILK